MNDTQRKRLLEPGWEYVPHEKTDIRVLFDRIRAEQAAKQKPGNVCPLRKGSK